MFIDKVRIRVEAGKGGDGVIAWTREKYRPRGGPCGGNGGVGGSVIIQATSNQFDLGRYRNQQIFRAHHGANGQGACRQGESADDITLLVPLGTIVYDAETKEALADLSTHGEQFVVCKGGRGGIGNNFFKNSYNPAPMKCTPGRAGEAKDVLLELKLIADVGFVGFPHAGKSTLLNALTAARVKVADYPFTTLAPNLSYIQWEDFTRTFIADIPGIIEGASNGRGLGFQFLKHIDRTKSLLFVLDSSQENPKNQYEILVRELEAYNPELLRKPKIVVLNKADLVDSSDMETIVSSFPAEVKAFPISALLSENLDSVKELLAR
ncbi:MAG: GTPase ObgE [Chlamydiia bacterium]